jgi:hypothetical protein
MSGENSAAAAGTSRALTLPTNLVARTDMLLLIAVLLTVALKFLFVFRININWDEFFFLSFVHDYLRGSLTQRLQTFHVHLFSWLAGLEADEIHQIIAGRLVMAALASASAALLYGISRRFLTRDGALFGVLAYLATTVVIEHGTSFRADPIATFLALLSLFLILRVPAGVAGMALAGIAMALSMLITIKSGLYVAVIGALIWCLGSNTRDRARLFFAFALPFTLAFTVAYLFHATNLPASASRSAAGFVRGAASKVFLEDGLFPRWADMMIVVAANPLFWFMAIYGVTIAWTTSRRDGGNIGVKRWLLLTLALPLLTPFFYRNAFAYYYVFILPPAAIFIGLSYESYRQRASVSKSRLAALLMPLLVAAQCAFLVANCARFLPDAIGPQRATLNAVHTVFPEPVPYIDGYGIVASFPRDAFFMSSWGMDRYHAVGEAVFPDLVAQAQPPLLLADSPSLYAALIPDITVSDSRKLLPEDVRFLKDNYVQHWGMLFVAGKRMELPSDGGSTAFDIVIAGDYRLEAIAPVRIDGHWLKPGDVVTLAAGWHDLSAGLARGNAVLRWADALPPPEGEAVDLFAFFDADS